MKNRTIPSVLLLGISSCCTTFAFAQGIVAGSHPTFASPALERRLQQIGELDNSATLALDSGDFGKAESLARQALALELPNSLSEEILAQALYLQGKDKEAFAAYKSIADFGGVFPRTLLPYADLLLKNGQYAEASKAYNIGIMRYYPGVSLGMNGLPLKTLCSAVRT